ncbi:MAG: DUF2330 domain-containing protein [Polyangiaceae bacterium]|nr:DUF2330 domain-containing protein [Polyangiaceae bacterium]
MNALRLAPRAARIALTSLLLTGALATVAPSDAKACGGCFHPPAIPTVVSGHRMVMAVSTEQSTLWDQIQYAGEPEEFAWVLPVKPGARVETATAAFFEVLEGTMQTRIQQPFVDCGGSGSDGLGCGSMEMQADFAGAAEDGANSAGGGDPVDVVHQGTVGPYETVTLSTEEPGALNTWLDSHGYAVDESTQPIIDAYVAEGFDFIALRLLPGKGVQEMTPVRVVSPGAGLSLPLRMVAVGTGAQTPIVLYVVGEGRYTVQNFPEVRLQTSLLSWNFRTSESNYQELRLLALGQGDGRGFLTTSASQGLLSGGFVDPQSFQPMSFLDLYAQQAFNNGETAELCQTSAPSFSGGSTTGTGGGPRPPSNGVVRNPCPAGEPWDSPACMPNSDFIDARQFGCEDLDDVATALEGLHLEDVWVTRLEANLPRAAFATDLVLQASKKQEPVASTLQATIAVEADAFCGAGAVPRLGEDAKRPPPKPWVGFYGLALAGAALAYAARRVTARRASVR